MNNNNNNNANAKFMAEFKKQKAELAKSAEEMKASQARHNAAMKKFNERQKQAASELQAKLNAKKKAGLPNLQPISMVGGKRRKQRTQRKRALRKHTRRH